VLIITFVQNTDLWTKKDSPANKTTVNQSDLNNDGYIQLESEQQIWLHRNMKARAKNYHLWKCVYLRFSSKIWIFFSFSLNGVLIITFAQKLIFF
jgi:hypothetical protein